VGFGAAAVIAIFLLLQAAFRSWRLAALAFLTLPVALVGGVPAALIDGATLSLGSLIAFLALLGIAARNGVMLIYHFQRLRVHTARDGFGAELVRRGAQDRLAPVLTTASALVLLLLPFVIMGDVAGLEIVHPMAIAMLGGLVTTTLLGLFALPALYLRFCAGAQPDAEFQFDPTRYWIGVGGKRADGDEEVTAEPRGPRRLEEAPERQDDRARREAPAGAGSALHTEDGDSASLGRNGE
jgi:predicted exporter